MPSPCATSSASTTNGSRSPSAQRVPDRKVFESSHEDGGGRFGWSGELDGIEPRDQFGEETPHRHPRERRAQTEVDAVPERQVFVGEAADVEGVRIVEVLLVPVARSV